MLLKPFSQFVAVLLASSRGGAALPMCEGGAWELRWS